MFWAAGTPAADIACTAERLPAVSKCRFPKRAKIFFVG
jgi:hypothetical protein